MDFLNAPHTTQSHTLCQVAIHDTDSMHTSMMSLLVRLSCGSLCSVYLSNTRSMSVLAYWNNLLALLNMISAISQSQSTLSSYAFFIRPNLRFVNVTFNTKQHTFFIHIRVGIEHSILPKLDYVTFRSLLSPIRLLSVCNVGATYSCSWTFWQYFSSAVYLGQWPSSDLCAKIYGDHPRGTPPLEVLKRKRGS